MPIVRLPGGDLRDEIRQPLYDTLSVAGSGVTSFTGLLTGSTPNAFDGQQFFSNIQGKQRWQTNMLQANLLQTAVSFRMQGMAIDAQYAQGVPAADALVALHGSFLPAVQDFASLRLRIGEKDYWEGPLSYQMGRIVGNAGQQAYQHAGQPAVQGIILAGRHVVDINPLQAFFAQLSVDVPASIDASNAADLNKNNVGNVIAGLDIVNLKMSLKGLLRRPVQ